MQQAYNPQTGEVLFLVNNQWVKPQQEAVNPETKERAFLVGNEWQVVPSSVFGVKPEPTPEEQSAFRQVADVPLKVVGGAVQGVRMIADMFGAGSDASNALRGAEDWIAALYSAQSKNDSREVARIMKEAEDKGVADQIKAGFRAFSVAPVDFIAQGLGTAAPTILAALGVKLLGAGALATTAITGGLGAGMGAGATKGAIYDAVKEELAKTDMPKDEIEKRAELAQRYNGENLDQILMGAGIGGIAARTGLEASVAKAAAARIAGKTAAAESAEAAAKQQVAEETAKAAARGPIRQGARTAGVETFTEGVQGSQERAAQNIALQREGFDVPTMRGVVGAGTLEALAGAPLGAAFGAREAIVARQEQERLANISAALNISAIESETAAEQPLEGVSADESQIQDRMIELMASRYESVLPKEVAYATALQMLEIRRGAEAAAKELGIDLPDTAAGQSTDTVVGVDPIRVRDLEDSFLAEGNDPGIAKAAAIAQATQEAYDDWIAERSLGDTSARQPVTPAGGEGVRVAGEPPAGPPAGGTGVSEAAGVVSPATDVGLPDGRKETAPGAVETVTSTPDLTGAPSVTETPQAVETKEEGSAAAAETTATKPAAVAKPAKPEKPLGVLALADKLANDAFTNLDQYKGSDQYEKLENAVSELRFALQTELENRGAKTGALAPTLARFDKKVAELRRDAVSRNPTLDPEGISRSMADAAFDQRKEYGGLEEAIDSYRDNLIDTLNEYKAGAFANDVALRAFDARVDELRKKEKPAPKKEKPAPKLSLRNARFAGAPSTERLFRAAAADKKYPGKFWSSIKEYAERYLTKGADKGQRTLEETAELPKSTLNITTLSQASKAEKDAMLAEFSAWMQKNAPNVPVEDTQLYDVLTDQTTDFAYPQKEDVKYLKYMGYDSVFFAEEGGEKVDTWFAFDKRERAEAVEPKPKRARGRPALPAEERKTKAKARTGVRAQANRDARRLKQVALDLTTKDKDRRRNALFTLLDIVKTSQSTPRVSQARNMLKANTTEAERAELEKGYGDWKAKQAEIAAFEAAEREREKATRLTPEEKKRQQEEKKAKKFRGSSIYIVEDLPDGEIGLVLPIVPIKAYPIEEAVKAGASFDEAKKAAEKQAFEEATKNVEGKTEGSTFRMVDKGAHAIQKQKKRLEEKAATASARRAKQTERIKIQNEDKINAQKAKLADLGKKLAAFRQNKPVDEAKLLLKEKQYKLEQLRLKVFEEKPIDWDADWEQGTKVRSLEDAAQEIRALQPKKEAKKGVTFAQMYATARGVDEKAGVKKTETDDSALAGLFDSQTNEEAEAETEAEIEAAVEPEATKKRKPKSKAKKPVEEPKQLTPQEQYASLVENLPGAPAFDALSEKAQKQLTDLAERNQLNLAAINRIAADQAPKFSQTPNVDEADARFSKFKTAAQAALHIGRAGNDFQRMLARRLSQLRVLKNTKFVVLGKGDPLPASLRGDSGWASARGVYVPSDNTIYVKDASDSLQGVNNITILHELLHAALHAKIGAGRRSLGIRKAAYERTGQYPTANIADVEDLFLDLNSIARRAEQHYNALMNTEEKAPDVITDLAVGANVFRDLDEFLSYGMSDPVFQEFLKTVPMKGATAFSRFTQALLKFLGLGSKNQSALAQLVDVTDRLIATKGKFVPSTNKIFPSKGVVSGITRAAQAGPTTKQYPKEVQEELKKLQKALGSASSIQKKAREQAANADKTLAKVLRSHSSSPQAMQALQQAVNNRGNSETTLNDVLASQYKAFKGGALRQLLPALQTETLVDWAGRLGLNNLVLAWDQMKNLHAAQLKGLNEAALISERLLKLQQTKPGMYKNLAVAMHYSTLRGVDPSTEAGRKASPSLARVWNALSPEAKSLYETVRDYHAANYNKHFELLEKLVDSYGLDGNIADASTPKGSIVASIRRMQEQGAGIQPYFPLMRFGNFWVRTGKGKDSTFNMFESQAEKELFITKYVRGTGKSLATLTADGLLKDGNDISSAREDMGNYNELLKRMFANIDGMQAQEVIDDFGNPSPELARIRKEELKDSIYQMILHTLPDASYRKQFIHRQGKEGFSEDIGRSFATLSTSMANQLARLEYSQQIQNAITAAKGALKGNPDASKLEEFVKEMKARADQQLDPSPENSIGNQMANFATQTSFLYMMTNVKTAVAQMFALPTFTAPVLASKHGLARTAKALGSFAAIWNSVGMRKENADGSTSWVAPTIAQSKRVKLNPEERRAAQYMVDRGLSETTLAYDLGNRKQTPTEVQNSAPRRMLRASVNAMTALFHHTERLIREVTFMASFRLYRQKFPNASFEEITQLAEKDTFEALGNYASINRPRGLGANAEREVMLDAHKPLGRAVLQFKMFPAFVTTYFVRNFYRMMGKGYTKEERKAAFIQFFGTLMMSFTLAGVMGIPGFSFALGVLSGLRKVMADDDEDDPLEKRNLELWFRNIWMPQTFGDIKIGGKPLSDIMDRGVVAALTGFDMTSSLSMNGLWLPSLKESPSAEASVKEYLLAIMGPFASLVGEQIPRAIDNFKRGKILEGIEQMMPAIARSPITAYRYATEGAQTTWGAEIKPAREFTVGQIIGQGLGFSTEGLVARREVLFRANQEAIKVKNEKRSLMDRLDQEVRTDDDVEAAMDKIIKFNQKNWFDPIEGGEVSKSLLRRMERRARADRGADVEPNYYPQMMNLLEGSRRKLEAEAAKAAK